jgi:hypothetical protein
MRSIPPVATISLRRAGVGWHRKKLEMPASEGQSIFLDVDGAISYAAVKFNGQIGAATGVVMTREPAMLPSKLQSNRT